MKKPILEKVVPGFGSSFTIKKFAGLQRCRSDFWHFHPEYEIVYITNGSGKRHIGNHISYYEEGDLIFLGPNLPHLSFTDDILEAHTEVVVQLRSDFLGADLWEKPEFWLIRQLFERARQGLSFSGKIKKEVGQSLLQLNELPSFERVVELLRILQQLATAEEYKLLQATGFALETNAQDRQRISAIYAYVEDHFQQNIALDDMAGEVSMTVPAFCRYFKKMTGKTFTQFVNEYRVAHASRLLANGAESISSICFDSGFNNFSHFNKQFKTITGKSPTAYRKALKQLVVNA